MKYLIDRFNKDEKSKYEQIDEKYFDSYEIIKSGVKKSIEHQNEIDLINELPVPPVDTELVYGSFYPTMATLILNDNDFTKDGETFSKGGDETVPTWSSLLTGLKWIYDKQKNNLPQNIKLIEYCSRLAKSGQYKYNPNIEQNFGAISCRCLKQDENVYLNSEDDIKNCSHAGMLQDENLFNYIYSVVNDPKENINDNFDSKKEAVNKFRQKGKEKYEEICNEDLYNILDTAK